MKNLTKESIDSGIKNLKVGLEKYYKIQNTFEKVNASTDLDFQKMYNGYYRVRRNLQWRNIYFNLLEDNRNNTDISFEEILFNLKEQTNRLEASFASKLVATINPNLPVIDSFVLDNMGLKLPYYSNKNRYEKTLEIYNKVVSNIELIKKSDDGQYMIDEFNKNYEDYNIADTKIIDLVLWQIRPAN